MRIAYLMVAHRNPQLLRRAIETLSFGDCAFFIHIDKKSNIEEFSSIQGKNVLFSEDRVSVHWGEFSVVNSVLLLIRQAVAAQPKYDYLVLLSGSDYPLRSGRYIQSFLEANQGTAFMSLVKMPNLDAGQPLAKINKWAFPSDQPVRRLAAKGLGKLGLAFRDYRRHLGNLEPYAGDMWWALTNDACRYAVEFVEQNPHVEKYFRETVAPDEMFFQTILGNSPFATRMRRNLTFADWSARGMHPAMIDEGHVARFEAADKVELNDVWGSGEALFARKVSDDNLDMVNRIDKMIQRKDSN